MARAKNKIELIDDANNGFNKLCKIIDTMNDELQNANFTFCDRDKNLRDVLAHLYEWHQLFLRWESDNSNGIDKTFLPEPYNWKTYPDMNIEFFNKHQTTALSNIKDMLNDSHIEVVEAFGKYTDEQLFTKAYYKWTGTTSFGQYCVSATVSHYDWAIKKIKKHIKEYC